MNKEYKGLPKKIKIGQRTYRIHVRNEKDDPMLFSAYAYTMSTYDNIVLADTMSRAKCRATLLHELLHAIKGIYGNPFADVIGDDDSDEDDAPDLAKYEHYFINLYQEPMIAMLRDNPALVTYLTDDND